jgi:predicted ABC-type ATPase
VSASHDHALGVEPPFFLIIAGPNGSGKSSAYEDTDTEAFGRSVWIINPDALTLRIRTVEGLEQAVANLEAVRRIETWLEASIRAHQTVGVETVLSTPKYRRLVELAKRLGFQVRLVYVLLDNVERNVERVRLRVKKGGHDVAEEKIRARHARSLAELPWFLNAADEAWLFDNSGAMPRQIGVKRDGAVTLMASALPDIAEAVGRMEG